MIPSFQLVHPSARAAIGAIAVAAACAFGYQLFVSFSDTTALQRAAGPDGTGLGSRGAAYANARTGRAWPEQLEARRQAAASAPLTVARSTP